MQEFTITANEDSYRLDNYIAKIAPSLSYIMIQKLIRLKKIKVNYQKQLPNYRLKANDKVEIYHEIDYNISSRRKKQFTAKTTEKLIQKFNDLIFFEDYDIIVLNKPANLAVQGGNNITVSVDTMLEMISDNYRLVHRLDRATSGILLIAKNLPTSRTITNLFKNGQIQKEYIAINKGHIAEKQGIIDIPILNGAEILPAKTKYIVVKYLSNDLTLTKFMPLTGRKHQLRIHSVKLGHPIMGDRKYDQNYDKTAMNLLLHAHKVDFFLGNKKYNFTIPIPDYFTVKF